MPAGEGAAGICFLRGMFPPAGATSVENRKCKSGEVLISVNFALAKA
jgi:hypothetical protein